MRLIVFIQVIGYDSIDEVVSELHDVSLNEVVIFINGVRHIQRLALLDKPTASVRTPLGRVLISGGSGGIGQSLLTHLRPSDSIVLSRSGNAVDGATKTVKGDCVKREDLEALKDIGPIDQVFHCAGTVANALRHSQTDSLMMSVLQPKVEGFTNMVEVAASASVDAMSSSAVILGSAGQANYAFANGWMADAAEVII